jgi:ribosomal protein S18 acetylase RimI-like enzyme
MLDSEFTLVLCNLKDSAHQKAFTHLMNCYRTDPMGGVAEMTDEESKKIIKDLQSHPTYLGFFVAYGDQFIGLANCFTNYSTFKAKPLLNIHDFIISPRWRGKKAAEFLLNEMAKYLKEKGFCRINLEVRNDNPRAMALYKKAGFNDCNPPMFFWEKYL